MSSKAKASNASVQDMSYRDRLQRIIPGGAHTYSRGADQFPANAPQILARGKGAYVYDDKGARYLDYGMGLRAVNIGYAEDEIDDAAMREIRNGNNLTRPSMVELEAAELFAQLIESAEMVKFTKNGSTSVSAAVKLARAFTGRELVARCAEHPFFSYDDWFIGSTILTRGVPRSAVEQTKLFRFNDIASLRAVFAENRGEIAYFDEAASRRQRFYRRPPLPRRHAGRNGDRRLSVVRRLGPRHDDLAARALPHHRAV
jgi:glutamate-1-semialdehyde 2,1-aminomutase